MADIDVVPRSKSNVWLWIIVAIVVALVLWSVMTWMDGAPADTIRPGVSSDAPGSLPVP